MNITTGHQSQNSAMHLQEKYQEANSKFHGFLVLSSNETANSMTKPLKDMDNGSTNRNSNQLSITSCSVSKAACQAEVMCGALYSHASLTPLHQFLTFMYGSSPIPENRSILQSIHRLYGDPDIQSFIENDLRCVPLQKMKTSPLQPEIIYEDEDMLIAYKQPYLLVHPERTSPKNTLMGALLNKYSELSSLPNAGIVHRLDKDTSGILIVARNMASYVSLKDKIRRHEFFREYQAVVEGVIKEDAGTLNQKVPAENRPFKKQRNGITHYRVSERFNNHSAVTIQLETGRRHQIRAHMGLSLRFPLVGDQRYRPKDHHAPEVVDTALQSLLKTFDRQALHAYKIVIQHPRTEHFIKAQAKPPERHQQLLQLLRQDNVNSTGNE